MTWRVVRKALSKEFYLAALQMGKPFGIWTVCAEEAASASGHVEVRGRSGDLVVN